MHIHADSLKITSHLLGHLEPGGDVFCLGVTFIQVLLDKSPPTGPRTTSTPGQIYALLGHMLLGGIFVEGCRTIEDSLLLG